MSFDPLYPSFPPAQVPPPPSAPPVDPRVDTHEAARLRKSFTITCVALGALAMFAGASVGSTFVFGAGIVLGLVGLISLVPHSTFHIGSHYPRTVIIPPYPYSYSPPSPVIFHLPHSNRSRPVFIPQTPQPTPLYPPGEHISVGNRGTAFNDPRDRVQVRRR